MPPVSGGCVSGEGWTLVGAQRRILVRGSECDSSASCVHRATYNPARALALSHVARLLPGKQPQNPRILSNLSIALLTSTPSLPAVSPTLTGSQLDAVVSHAGPCATTNNRRTALPRVVHCSSVINLRLERDWRVG